MRRNTLLLTCFLILDVISTVLILFLFDDAKELNPILNLFGNVFISVVVSHIIAIFIIWWVYFYTKKRFTDKMIKKVKINFIIVNIFYFIVVCSNFIQLFINIKLF